MDGGLPGTLRCFPHSRHSRYQPPSGLRSRCQRCLPMRHSQGLAIVASLWASRSGSVKAIQIVQLRESTPLLLLAYRDPRLRPAISPGRSREASPGLTRQRRRRPGRRAHPGPVANSTSDATVRDAGEACPVFRSVVSVLLRSLGDFSLHPQGRPWGRPPAAAALGRQHSTSTPLIIHGGAHRNKT